MNIIAFVLFIIAAVIFFVVSDTVVTRYGRSSASLGLGVLTVGFIVQFASKAHDISF